MMAGKPVILPTDTEGHETLPSVVSYLPTGVSRVHAIASLVPAALIRHFTHPPFAKYQGISVTGPCSTY